jgi:hypothetical protein
MKNVSDKNCRPKQDTLFMFSKFSENHAIYAEMWKNRPQMTIKCSACTFLATDTN